MKLEPIFYVEQLLNEMHRKDGNVKETNIQRRVNKTKVLNSNVKKAGTIEYASGLNRIGPPNYKR